MKTDILALIVFFMMGFNLCIPVIQKQFEIYSAPVKAEPLGDGPFNNTEYLGYELVDNNSVLHMWNQYDSYYFNVSNGIQFSNHYEEYWTRNMLMLGFYAGDDWNLIYRTDELTGFNKNINGTTNETINATIWKDLSYGDYDFRLAIRYCLGVDDSDLTVIPYIKNLGIDIPYVLGFGWEMKDIKIDNTKENDYIRINRTEYYLNQTLDNTYTNLSFPIYNETLNITGWTNPRFDIVEDITASTGEYLYMSWDRNLTYLLKVKNRTGQYNAPVTLFIRVGTLGVGQEKSTELHWVDASTVTYYYDGYDGGDVWANNPDDMVDNVLTEYASATDDDDTQTCNSNTCDGTNLGTISKVELRAYGYVSATPPADVAINTQHDLGGWCLFTTNPGWSGYIDVTSHDPAWTWTDVDNLFAIADTICAGATVYCAKIDVQVTYTPIVPNNASTMSTHKIYNSTIPYEKTFNATHVDLFPTSFNVTINDLNGDKMNITILENSSGFKVVNQTSGTGSANGTYNFTNMSWIDTNATTYWVFFNLTDGIDWTNETYHLTTVASDETPPTITINFSGNPDDKGGPYWQAPGENFALTSPFYDGYYTNDSKQIEDYIEINCTIDEPETEIYNGDVYLNWLNESTWTSWTYKFANTVDDHWFINTSGTVTVSSGYNYSFNIAANSSGGNGLGQWYKTGIGGSNSIRRYVQLDCSPDNISYTTPLYIWNTTYTATGKKDRQHRDQGQDGTYDDSGLLKNDLPIDAIQQRYCGGFWGCFVDIDNCSEADVIDNLYVRLWLYESVITSNYDIYLGKTRDEPPSEFNTATMAGKLNFNITTTYNRSTIPYYSFRTSATETAYLNTMLIGRGNLVDYNFTDNDIYEFALCGDGSGAEVIGNRSFLSGMLINVPSNATLNASFPDSDGDGLSDWYELYKSYTWPFLADTDNDGVSDYDENLSGSDPNNWTDTIEYKQWTALDTWNLTLGNMSISPYTLDTWNMTLSNLTITLFTIDTWNVTLSNLTISSFTIDAWNMTLSNLSISPYTLDTWNITLSNTTTSYALDVWNVTLSNLSISSFIIDTWNLTLSNTPQPYTLDTWNLTLGNMSISLYTLDTWNLTLGNLSISPFTLDIWNITLSNTTQPYTLDAWNVTLSNLTISPYVLDTWNLTLSNTTQSYMLDTWNVTLSNTTVEYTIDTWNVTLGNLTISPFTIDTWNLTLSNTPEATVLDTWNITLSNLTISPFTIDTWNITLSNLTISPYTLDIWNITLSNTTQPCVLDKWNLTLGNLTISAITIDQWNLTLSNTSIKEWETLDTWNLTLSNLTISQFTIDTWNLTLSNLTISPFTIDTWNLTLSNTTQSYMLDTWNVTLSNTTVEYTLDTWNVTLGNLTISSFTIDTWNITLSNTSVAEILDQWNLTLSNTSWLIALDMWNVTLSNTTIKPDPPTDFTATANGQTQIDLAWDKGDGVDKTYIEWKPSGTWDRGDGIFLYNDTGVSTSDSGLAPGTTRCYQGWSWNNTYNTWSTTYDGDCATTESPPPPNNPPNIANEYPLNTSISIPVTPLCSVYVTDADGDTTTVKFYNSTDGITYNIQQTNNSIPSGSTVTWRYAQATLYNTKYYWRITANDGEDTTTENYYFTTYETSENWPILTNETPVNQSYEQNLTVNWTIYIADPNGDTINWTINCSNGQNSSADLDTNGTKNVTLSGLTEYTTYTVYVNVTDGTNWVRKTYIFTTVLITFYGRFTYVVKGGMVTIIPTIYGATHYRWTVVNESGVKGETTWIAIEDICNYILGFVYPTTIRVTLSIKNVIVDRIGKDYSEKITIYKSSFDKPEPVVEEPTPEPTNIFKEIYDTIRKWFGERNAGEILFMIVMSIILVIAIIMKKYPKKRVIFTVLKKKKKE